VQGVKASAGQCDTSDPNTISCTLADITKGTESTVTIDMELQDGGLLMVRQQAITHANNYPSDSGGGNAMIDIPESIKADIVILLDTTGSMQMELDGTIAAVKELLANLPTNQKLTMALVEFKDDVKVKAFTQDPQILINALEQLVVEGGGMCPEASAEALTIGLRHISNGGTILLITDASPYPDADLTGMADLIKQKSVRFNALISGDCAASDSMNEGNDDSGTDGGEGTDNTGTETSGNDETPSSDSNTGNSDGAETDSESTDSNSANTDSNTTDVDNSGGTETGSEATDNNGANTDSNTTDADNSGGTETGSEATNSNSTNTDNNN
jgi:hypothetical protein